MDGAIQSYDAQPRAGTSYELCCDVAPDFGTVGDSDSNGDTGGTGNGDTGGAGGSGDTGGEGGGGDTGGAGGFPEP